MKPQPKLTLSELEKALAEFYSSLPAIDDDEVVDFSALHRTDGQIESIISKPSSPYNKIVTGHAYIIDGRSTIMTGCGGAQIMYKAFLKEGLSEAMIEELIYIVIDKKEYPLKAIKLYDGRA